MMCPNRKLERGRRKRRRRGRHILARFPETQPARPEALPARPEAQPARPSAFKWLQLTLVLTDFKGPTIFICYRQISVTANI